MRTFTAPYMNKETRRKRNLAHAVIDFEEQKKPRHKILSKEEFRERLLIDLSKENF